MYQRNSTTDLKAALSDSPILLINGARQVGKSTVAKMLLNINNPVITRPGNSGSVQYITMDDISSFAAATSSPDSFLQGLPDHAIIDEIQRAPQLFLSMKKMVDEDRRPGRFLLTGSTNVMTLPKLVDSLAGRMEIHTIWPLSQGELNNHKENFIDICFDDTKLLYSEPCVWADLMEKIIAGGYPEVQKRTDKKRRAAWYASYLTSILERDIQQLANIEGLLEMPNLLQLLAARAGGLLNLSDISRISKISNTSLKRYVSLLEAVFLFVPLPAWCKNEEKRIVKSPKTYLNDTGLLCHLRGLDKQRLVDNRNIAGGILENFIVMELRKQLGWSNVTAKIYHFRTSTGQEVDIILEAPDGKMVCIEVKSSNDVSMHDFSGINALKAMVGANFHRGIVLYTGANTLSFGPNLTALPVTALWQL